jgi:hypothetical protein
VVERTGSEPDVLRGVRPGGSRAGRRVRGHQVQAATYLKGLGVDDRILAAITGHDDPRSVEKYAKVQGNSIRRVLARPNGAEVHRRNVEIYSLETQHPANEEGGAGMSEDSNPSLSATPGAAVGATGDRMFLGEMAERSKARAWRARVPKGTVGSNPTLSAN